MLPKDIKEHVIKTFAQSSKDVGSSEVQVALLSARIKQIAVHLKSFPKDYHSQRGLLLAVGQRRTQLVYLKRVDARRHEKLMKSLQANGYM